MTNVQPAISIAAYYQNSTHAKFPKDDTAQPVTATTPVFRNITIRNLTATSTKDAGMIVGLPEALVENVLLENVTIHARTGGLTLSNAKNIRLQDVKIETDSGQAYYIHNAQVEGLPAGVKETPE